MTFAQIILMWPSTAEFSRDVGVTIDLASKWRRERGIPSAHWPAVLSAAKKRKIKLVAETLMEAERLQREQVA